MLEKFDLLSLFIVFQRVRRSKEGFGLNIWYLNELGDQRVRHQNQYFLSTLSGGIFGMFPMYLLTLSRGLPPRTPFPKGSCTPKSEGGDKCVAEYGKHFLGRSVILQMVSECVLNIV